jgi:Tripartite tricarboxylate transporter family receptor
MPKLPRAPLSGRMARRTVALFAAAFTAAALIALPTSAEKWPERSITLIVPFAAGGASDVSSRIMAEVMSKHLGQSIIIENVAGAGGATGSLRGKNAKPDGYTIGFAHMGTHAARWHVRTDRLGARVRGIRVRQGFWGRGGRAHTTLAGRADVQGRWHA